MFFVATELKRVGLPGLYSARLRKYNCIFSEWHRRWSFSRIIQCACDFL